MEELDRRTAGVMLKQFERLETINENGTYRLSGINDEVKTLLMEFDH